MLKILKFLKSVRYCLAAVNGLFLLTGLLMLAVGIAVLVVYQEYELFVTQRFFTLPGFVIATGVIILLASLLGFYGAYSEQFYFIAGYECCGVAGRHDWPSAQVPISCCHIDFGTISPFECNTGNAYTVGCASALGERLAYNAHVLGATVLFVTCLQVLMTAASGYLAYRSKFEEVELES